MEKKAKNGAQTEKSVSEEGQAVDWGKTAAFFKTEEPGSRHIQTSFTPTAVTIHAEPHGPHGGRSQTKQANTT